MTGYHRGQPYVSEPRVKDFIRWTKTLKDEAVLERTLVGGHYCYPPAPPALTQPLESGSGEGNLLESILQNTIVPLTQMFSKIYVGDIDRIFLNISRILYFFIFIIIIIIIVIVVFVIIVLLYYICTINAWEYKKVFYLVFDTGFCLAASVTLVAADDLKRALESLRYREHRRLAIQGLIAAVRYVQQPPGDTQPGGGEVR